MSAPQQTGAMQAATLRCPPNVFRERYSLADFELTHTYGEGENWSIYAARCKWSNATVVLQTYTEVGNLSGCMAMALAAAHGLTHHQSLLPLYAVFRDVAPPDSSKGSGGSGGVSSAPRLHTSGGGGGGPSCDGPVGDRVVMVYPGGPAQHPLDTGSSPSSPPLQGGPCGGSGPPVSERGVVRGLLQPLADLVAVLGSMGLRPPYVCGLDVWMDSPEAPGPGQALFMVPLLCHRRAHTPPAELLPAAAPYVAPYLRANPMAACDQNERNEGTVKKWLSWSAAVLVHTVLIGSPPPDKPAARKARRHMQSEAAATITNSTPPSTAANVPQLPPLTPASNNSTPRGSPPPPAAMMMMMMPQRGQSLATAQPGLNRISANGYSGGGGATNGDFNGGVSSSNSASKGGLRIRSPNRNARALDPMPLWLSDEAADWFRRGLAPDCSVRTQLDEQMKHAWVCRHAAPRSSTLNSNMFKRESLGGMPRELHPLMLDVVPLGLTRPGREEVDNLMAEMAMTEAPSAAKPAMPWQVVEGPQGPAPGFTVVVVEEEFSQDGGGDADSGRDTGVVERYEVAEEQKDDGTRVVEELRVVAGKQDGGLSRAAKALQAAMARRNDVGQWVLANPRGTTFDDIARQKELSQRTQMSPPLPATKRRESNGAPAPPPPPLPPPPSDARNRSTERVPVAASGARSAPILPAAAAAAAAPGPAGRNKSPGPKGKAPIKTGKVVR